MSCKILSNNFPAFTVDNKELVFVKDFKYLGTVITDTLRDDCDIEREIRCLFVRYNILISRFRFCSWHVKLRLFRTYRYCTCFYNIGLWRAYNVRTLRKFNSCYNKCLKRFFGFSEYSCLTTALLQTGLASSSTVLHNFTWRFKDMLLACDNAVVSAMSSLCF